MLPGERATSNSNHFPDGTVVIFVGLSLLSAYSLMTDDKQLSAYIWPAWVAVFIYVWFQERAKTKALEEAKLQALQDRVADLERQRQQQNHQP
jgi:hypothetical protein